VRQTNNQLSDVYEVLSLQCCGVTGDSHGEDSAKLQAPEGWGAVSVLCALGQAVFAGTSRGWDTRGSSAVLSAGGGRHARVVGYTPHQA
jgi:hypothetical protein